MLCFPTNTGAPVLPRDPLIDALVGELEVVLAGAQAARKIIAQIERNALMAERAARARRGAAAGAEPGPSSLRYSGMTVSEAAGVLGMSEEHVRRLLRKGELPGVSLGGRVGWRLAREEVQSIAVRLATQREAQAEARGAAQRTTPRRGQRKRSR